MSQDNIPFEFYCPNILEDGSRLFPIGIDHDDARVDILNMVEDWSDTNTNEGSSYDEDIMPIDVEEVCITHYYDHTPVDSNDLCYLNLNLSSEENQNRRLCHVLGYSEGDHPLFPHVI